MGASSENEASSQETPDARSFKNLIESAKFESLVKRLAQLLFTSQLRQLKQPAEPLNSLDSIVFFPPYLPGKR